MPVNSVGILGLESHGLRDRSVAMDTLHGLSERAGLRVAFHHDLAFDEPEKVWETIAASAVDALLVSVRASGGTVLPRLAQALDERTTRGTPAPTVAFGGTTAIASPDLIAAMFPHALVFTCDAELAFPAILSATTGNSHPASVERTYQSDSFQVSPAHVSTAKAVQSGGTIWLEASRGCRLRCTFCVLSNGATAKGWSPRPIEHLFDEIEHIIKTFGVDDFSFSDFSAFEETSYLDDFIRERNRRALDFTFRCDMRVGVAAKLGPRLADLRAAGLRQVFMGVESMVPRLRRLYRKNWQDLSCLRVLKGYGIDVVVGFIILDPLMSPSDFRENVVGIERGGLLPLIGNPHKLMRLQRGTTYEQFARDAGIAGPVKQELYTLEYRCEDRKLEAVRRILTFFDSTTTRVYYNNYIENMVKTGKRHVEGRHLQTLHSITARYKNEQYDLLRRMADVVTTHNDPTSALPALREEAMTFSRIRREIFAATAEDYQCLLDDGILVYRDDLRSFVQRHALTPEFDDSFPI